MILLLAVLAAILGAFLATGPFAAPYANPDSLAFEALARSLLAGRGLVYHEVLFPNVPLFAFRSPVYAVFLAGTLSLGGVGFTLAVQGALAGATAALVGALAGVLAGRRAAWVAFALALAWPPAWQFAGELMSETLYTFLAVAATYAVCRSVAGRSAGAAACGGALASLAMLTRSQGALALPALAVAFVRRFPRGAAWFALAALLVWAPWPIRNAVRTHHFVPLLTSGGINAWAGATGRPISDAWYKHDEAWKTGDELAVDRQFIAEGRAAVLGDPVAFARRVAARVVRHVLPLESDAWTTLHRAIWPLAFLALCYGATRRRLAVPIAVWVANAIPAVLCIANSRYRFPTEWVVVLAAAVGLDELVRRYGRARGYGWSALVAVAIAVLGRWLHLHG